MIVQSQIYSSNIGKFYTYPYLFTDVYTFLTNRKLLFIHSRLIPISMSKASLYSYAEKKCLFVLILNASVPGYGTHVTLFTTFNSKSALATAKLYNKCQCNGWISLNKVLKLEQVCITTRLGLAKKKELTGWQTMLTLVKLLVFL